MTFTLTIRTAEDLEAERLAARLRLLRRRRDLAIAAGTVRDGIPVQTDDLSQSRITGAALAATLDPEATVRWKMADGQFVTLDAPAIIALAQTVRAHVQACFDHEADLRAQIEAGEAPDIEAGWPGARYRPP